MTQTQTWEDAFTQAGRAGVPVPGCSLVDAHGHLDSTCCFPYVDSSADKLVAAMDRYGIAKAWVSSTWSLFSMARQGNDHILEAVRQHPGRIYGYMVADVGYPETIIPELERCYEEGLRAIKLWSYGSRDGLHYDHPNYKLVYQFANEHHLPILAHTWGQELYELDEAFQRYPNIRWMLAHTGSQDLAKYVQVANEYPHVHLETCLSSCPRGLFEYLVANVPLHKIIWGTDEVFMSASNQLGRVFFARIGEQAKRAIMCENALRVLMPEL